MRHDGRIQKVYFGAGDVGKFAAEVVGCWLEAKHAEGLCATPGTRSLDQANFRLKRLESAQKRVQSAIKTLTTLRVLLPAGLAPAQAIRLHQQARKQA